jgi:hypothetical protein
MGNVVFLSAMRSKPIRDRPIPYRHRFGGLLGDDYRDVA